LKEEDSFKGIVRIPSFSSFSRSPKMKRKPSLKEDPNAFNENKL
jgi:hypothetical protein